MLGDVRQGVLERGGRVLVHEPDHKEIGAIKLWDGRTIKPCHTDSRVRVQLKTWGNDQRWTIGAPDVFQEILGVFDDCLRTMRSTEVASQSIRQEEGVKTDLVGSGHAGHVYAYVREMIALALFFLLQGPETPAPEAHCKGTQCAVGCFPLGSTCPSATEARLQGILTEEPSTVKPTQAIPEGPQEEAPRKRQGWDLSSWESCEERKWSAIRRKLGIGLGIGIPAAVMVSASIPLLSAGVGAREASSLLPEYKNDLPTGAGYLVAGGVFLGTGLILGIVALVSSISIEIPSCSPMGCTLHWSF